MGRKPSSGSRPGRYGSKRSSGHRKSGRGHRSSHRSSYGLYVSWPYVYGSYGYYGGYGYYPYTSYYYRPYYGYGYSYTYPSSYYTNSYSVVAVPSATETGTGAQEQRGVYQTFGPQEGDSTTPHEAQTASEALRFSSALSASLGGPRQRGPAFTLGEAKLKEGGFADAATAFRHALRTEPDSPSTRIALALACAGDGQYENAAYVLRSGLASMPGPGGVRLDVVDVYGGPSAYEKVEGRLREAVQGAPDDADLGLLLGFQYLASGRYEQASDVLRSAHEAARADQFVLGLLLAAERRRAAEPSDDAETN